jgi:hypothetical protein
MINLRTRQAKLREHAEQDRLRQMLAKSLEIRLRQEFSRLAKAITPLNFRLEIFLHKRYLYAILWNYYKRVFQVFGSRVHLMVSMARGMATKDNTTATGPGSDAYQQAIAGYAQRNAKKKAAQIGSTTFDIVTSAMATEPDQDNPLQSDLAKDIQDAVADVSAARARTIARTETHGASQDATFETVQVLGLDVTKEWVSTLDDRTRDSHVEADGQEVEMHERFELEYDDLMYPGDPDGEAIEVINCRCICVYNE